MQTYIIYCLAGSAYSHSSKINLRSASLPLVSRSLLDSHAEALIFGQGILTWAAKETDDGQVRRWVVRVYAVVFSLTTFALLRAQLTDSTWHAWNWANILLFGCLASFYSWFSLPLGQTEVLERFVAGCSRHRSLKAWGRPSAECKPSMYIRWIPGVLLGRNSGKRRSPLPIAVPHGQRSSDSDVSRLEELSKPWRAWLGGPPDCSCHASAATAQT